MGGTNYPKQLWIPSWKRSWCTFSILDQFASTCLEWRISLEQFSYFPFGPRSFSLLVSYANFCGVFGSFPRAAIFTKPAKRIDATGGDEPFMSCRIHMNQHHITVPSFCFAAELRFFLLDSINWNDTLKLRSSHPRRCSTRGAAAKVEADAAERDAAKEVEVPLGFFLGKVRGFFGGKKKPLVVLFKDTKKSQNS